MIGKHSLGNGANNMTNFPDYVVQQDGEIFIKSKGRIAGPEYRGDGKGYQHICFYNKDTDEKELINVTHLVADMYVPNPSKFNFVRHKDGILFNNHPSNLEWVETRAEVVAPHRPREAWERSVKRASLSTRQRMRMDKTHEATKMEVILCK